MLRSTSALPAYNGQTVSMTLPAGKKWTDYDYLSIWCESFGLDFGHVVIPNNIQLPTYSG